MRELNVAQDEYVSQAVATSGSVKGDVGVKLRARLRVDGEHHTDPSLSPRSKLAKAACTFASKPAIFCRPKVRARHIRTTTSTPLMLWLYARDAVHTSHVSDKTRITRSPSGTQLPALTGTDIHTDSDRGKDALDEEATFSVPYAPQRLPQYPQFLLRA